MLDLYCERCGPGLLAEPINASTNVAFLIAAWASWILARRADALSAGIWGLIFLSVTIGVGSALFHTFATGWARWLDIIPILLFQLCFLWLYLRRIVGIGRSLAAASLAGFLAAALLGRRFPGFLNGSLIYAPAFLVLVGLGLYHFWHRQPERLILLSAASVFLLSLFFRSIDEAVCPRFPTGTHFLWHLLNALLLYLSMRSLIASARSTPALAHSV
jgi:hypothetical protein